MNVSLIQRFLKKRIFLLFFALTTKLLCSQCVEPSKFVKTRGAYGNESNERPITLALDETSQNENPLQYSSDFSHVANNQYEVPGVLDYRKLNIPAVCNGWTSQEMRNRDDFAGILNDGNLFVCGPNYKNLATIVEKPPERNIVSVFSSGSGFVALLDNQQLITKNPDCFHLDYPTPEIPEEDHVISLASNEQSFTALLENGKIFSWGKLQAPTLPAGKKAISIFSNNSSFCAVLENETTDETQVTETIISWGEVHTPPFQLRGKKVVSIIGNEEGFCALLNDGTLRLWGKKDNIVRSPLLKSIKKVSMKEGSLCATSKSFVVLFEDGILHSWGDLETPERPYDSSSWISSKRLRAVSLISNQVGITAILEDGSFLNAWVKTSNQHDASGKVSLHTQQMTRHIAAPCNSHGQKLELYSLVASNSAFAALFNNGSVVSWGNEKEGGKGPNLGNNKAIDIFSSGGGFTALLENGKILSWGDAGRKDPTPQLENDVTVKKMIGNYSKMSALLSDNSLLMWGYGINDTPIKIRLPGEQNLLSFVSPFEKFLLCETPIDKEFQKMLFPYPIP